jgi:HB1, ASXL, restriction endonuclease HTH domain
MSRSTANHQTVIRCDSPVCPSRTSQDHDRFVTYSIAMRARLQARAVGWERLPAWTITTEDSPRRLYDICPLEAPAARDRKGKRAEILLAERTAQKAARTLVLAARDLARIEKRDQCAKRKAEKVAERDRRAADRAKRKTEIAARDPLTVAVVERILTSPPLPAPQSGSPILAIVARMLHSYGRPMTVTQIVEHAIGDLALPTASRTPRTIVARDLAIDIKKYGDSSRFVRVAPGTFALRGGQ